MKTLILKKTEQKEIYFKDSTAKFKPMFVIDDKGRLKGMVVLEPDGYLVKTGLGWGYFGHRDTLQELIEYGQHIGLRFVIEAKVTQGVHDDT